MRGRGQPQYSGLPAALPGPVVLGTATCRLQPLPGRPGTFSATQSSLMNL